MNTTKYPPIFHLLALVSITSAFAILNLDGHAAETLGAFYSPVLGAKADGTTDATAAIQDALDQASKKGGRVLLSPGRYLVKGSLRIPPGVTLEGVMESPVWSEPLKGSIVLATGGRQQEDGPALFEMAHSSAVRGLTVWYPEQQVTNITAYSWTFHLQGNDNTVENVTLINSYNGIRIGPEGNVRHRIRSVYGCVLRRGILVDGCSISVVSTMFSSIAIGGRRRKSAAIGSRRTNSCGRTARRSSLGGRIGNT